MKCRGILYVALIVAVLPACASTPSNRYAATRSEVDNSKVAIVNQIALRRGVQTTWVNPPTKRVPLAEGRND